jgi:hypothetical protein
MNDQKTNLCSYYQAIIKREECWLLTATLRSFEHLCFDRTLDKTISMFEFFVPIEQEHYFIDIMKAFEQQGLVSELNKLPNRLLDPQATL